MPLPGDFRPEQVADELVDMMQYEVIGQGDGARFLITAKGQAGDGGHATIDRQFAPSAAPAEAPSSDAIVELD